MGHDYYDKLLFVQENDLNGALNKAAVNGNIVRMPNVT